MKLKAFIAMVTVFDSSFVSATTLTSEVERIVPSLTTSSFAVKNMTSSASSLELQQKAIKRGLLPQLSLQGTHQTAQFGFIDQINIRLSQSLFQGGADWAALQIAELSEDQSRYQLSAQERKTRLAILDQLTVLFLARLDYQLAQKLESLFTDRLKDLKQRASIGKSKETDWLSAQTQVMRSAQQVTEWQEQQSKLLINLNVISEASIHYKLPTAITPMTVSELLISVDQTIRKLTDYSIHSSPGVLEKQKIASIADQKIKITRAAYYPTLNAFVAKPLLNAANDISFKEDFVFGLALNWNLWSWGADKALVERESLQREIAQNTAQQSIKQEESLVEQLKIELNSFKQRLKTQKELIELQKKLLVGAKRDEQRGLITSLEMNTILVDVEQSTTQYQKMLIQLESKLLNANYILQGEQ